MGRGNGKDLVRFISNASSWVCSMGGYWLVVCGCVSGSLTSSGRIITRLLAEESLVFDYNAVVSNCPKC